MTATARVGKKSSTPSAQLEAVEKMVERRVELLRRKVERLRTHRPINDWALQQSIGAGYEANSLLRSLRRIRRDGR